MATKKEIEINLKSTLDGKGVEEAKQKIDSLNKSTDQLDKDSQRATKSIKNMGQGMLQVAYFMDDVQYGIKGILNNIPGLVIGFGGGAGLAGALSLATLAGAKLYEWLSDSADKTDDLAKKMKEQSKEVAEAYRQSIRESYQALQEFNRDNRAQAVNKEYDDYIKGITQEYEKQTSEIKEQLDLRKKEISYRENIKTADLENQKAQTELNFEQGNITKRERDRRLLEIDQEFERRRENTQISILESEIKALEDELSEKEYLLGQTGLELNNIFNSKRSLPSSQEMLYALMGENRTRRGIQTLNDKRNNYKIDPDQYEQEYNALIKDNERFSAILQNAKDSLSKAGIPFYPSFAEGKTALDIEKEYQKSIDSLTKKQEELEKSAFDLSESFNFLERQISGKKEDIRNLEDVRGIREETRTTRLDIFDEQKDREEKNNQQRERLKKLENDLKRDKDNFESIIDNFIVSAGESANDQQRALVRAASEAIRDQVKKAASDGVIDSREYAQIGAAFRDALRQQGVSTNSIINGLVGNLKEALSIVNIQSGTLNEHSRDIEQIKRELEQVKNNVGGLRRRKH